MNNCVNMCSGINLKKGLLAFMKNLQNILFNFNLSWNWKHQATVKHKTGFKKVGGGVGEREVDCEDALGNFGCPPPPLPSPKNPV